MLGLAAARAEGAPPPLTEIDVTIARAADGLGRAQQDDGHWVFELEADVTIPSEYVLLRHWLDEPVDTALEAALGRYIRRLQCGHGGWSLFHDGAFDISATVKAYYALKLIGDDVDAPHMARARAEILKSGGAGSANVFTRIQLALLEAGPWSSIPEMPVEMALLPKWFPVHLLKMSYWARTVLVPLLVLMTLRPKPLGAPVPGIPELYSAEHPHPPRPVGKKRFWRWFFGGLDQVLKAVRPIWPESTRARAIAWCEGFVTERLNGEDGLGAIYPAMANSVMMYAALGYAADHPLRATARGSLEKLIVRRPDGEVYCQPCVSPIWDTALAAHAMMEVGTPEAEESAIRGLDWLVPKQITTVRGDWAEVKPDVPAGGWAFQYANDHYPDTDDTAVVAMAMDRARGLAGQSYDDALARARLWVEGMQSRNGGWGSFDADNTHYHLNEIPFADHGALLDPPTVDVSARCVGMLAQMGEPLDGTKMQEAIGYLLAEQEADGSWFGRWGVNYIYGTWSALCALNAAALPFDHPAMRRAVKWLTAIQNPDGGWGEGCDSYKLDYKGFEPAPSTASQTAWALIGLMAAGEVESDAVARGIEWLRAHQQEDGLWGQEHYTGGGFPRVFYLRYHGYPAYFPLWAVARYRNLKRANDKRVGWGI